MPTLCCVFARQGQHADDCPLSPAQPYQPGDGFLSAFMPATGGWRNTMESGQIGYEAYAASTGGKTFDGRPMPTWDEIVERSPHVAKAWNDAASAIGQALLVHSTRVTGLSFGDALKHLHEGHRVARAGWNGKAMWIALTPGSVIDHAAARAGAARLLAAERESAPAFKQAVETHVADPGRLAPWEIAIGAHIDMRAADGSLVIGWLASQTDMLAEDWMVLE